MSDDVALGSDEQAEDRAALGEAIRPRRSMSFDVAAVARTVLRRSTSKQKACGIIDRVGESSAIFGPCGIVWAPSHRGRGSWLSAPTSNLLRFDCERRSSRCAAGGC